MHNRTTVAMPSTPTDKPSCGATLAWTSLFIASLLLGLLLSMPAYSEIYRYIDPKGRLILTNQLKPKNYILLKETPEGWVVANPKTKRRYSWTHNKREFSPTIRRIAKKYRLPNHLLHAIITVESAYDPDAKSHAGAQGLMQLMPATATRFGVSDPYNPQQNINGGSRYLKYLLKLFDNNLVLTLAAYNAGEHAVMKYGNRIPPYKETQQYVRKVLKYYKKYKATS